MPDKKWYTATDWDNAVSTTNITLNGDGTYEVDKVAPSTTGGEISQVVDDGITYRVHEFPTVGNSTFTVDQSVNIDVFMIAGGGGGGGGDGNTGSGGGGGAGGMIFRSEFSISDGSYQITVGDGGAGDRTNGYNGEDTEAFGLTAIGGGAGGRGDTTTSGIDGGCGGGGGGDNGSNNGGNGLQPTSTDGGYGEDGGRATTASGDEGGGGGGIGQEGFNGRAYNDVPPSGPGGDGLYEVNIGGIIYNFSDMFDPSYGVSIDGEKWFGGGGAGHADDRGGGLVPGGKGGGGDFNDDTREQFAGVDNTGSGGAGGGKNGESLEGEPGGSGLVMIRVALG